jgi:hypothetical protein
MNRTKTAACLVGLLLAPAAAAALELGLPLQCEPGRTCWMPRYVDLDPGPGFKDYQCGGRLGENDHSGTDFAIPSLAAMRAGVPVVASADGRVRNVRDGMDDVSVATIGKAAIEGRNCGNGVAIEHGDGWETQYCHLRKGSVTVRPGQEVSRGQPLGLVGMSGEASFPHVHLSVRKGSDEVDPFRGTAGGPACGAGTTPLWQAEVLARLTYLPVMLTHAGFAGAPPTWEQVQNGDFDGTVLPLDAPALVLWLEAFEVGAGDRVSWRIAGPDGTVLFEDANVEAKAQRQAFRFAGKRRPAAGWAPGTYAGTVTIERDGAPRQERSLSVELR